MNRTVLFFLLLLFTYSIQAKNVETQTAQKVGLAYYYEHVNQFIPVEFKALNVTSVYTEYENTLPVYYVFNIDKNGFVIVSADDIATPVLGYSYESDFKANELSPNLQYWLNGVKKTIVDAIKNNLTATEDIHNSWDYYKSRTSDNLSVIKDKAVSPLLTSTWNQGKYYNQLCPEAPGGPDNKAYAGCVATAMCQIMYYYRYPNQGLGTHGYNSTAGYFSANYGATTYNWDNMLDNLGNYNIAMATLLYQAGVSVDMDYAFDGSGAVTADCPSALISHFRYNNTCDFVQKDFYSSAGWINLLKSNIDARHPLIYSGTDPANGGHAWNCDGYDASDNFHMNWGWSGSSNGYFAIDNLTAGGFSFSDNNGIVYNFFPPAASYPYNCIGTKTLTYITGTIEDGSGSGDYQNNQDCLWLIDPTETVSKIMLNFISFSTESGNDVITIYDGNSTTSPVLGTYSGSLIPAGTITSTGPQMLVRFQTNGSNVSSGWKASYRCSFPYYCSGLTTLTTPTGSFEDGSSSDNYSYNYLCRWSISPVNASSITLNFSSFNLANNDSLHIYKQNPTTKLASYSGNLLPSSHTYNYSTLMVVFRTDAYLNSQGFNANYTSTLSDIDENNSLKEFSVFPNPSNTKLNIQFATENIETLKIQLISISGQTVYNESLNNFSGSYNKSIETNSFAKGVYLLRIIGEKQAIHEKIIIE
jgi:hypothetical protein